MAKSLVVVESPAKAKTINKYLGKDYKVIASMGHVRDLPKSKLGVDVDEDFEPTYEVIASRKKVLKELKDEAKKATNIFMATDPDREGEAIGWHLAEELGATNKKKIRRLMFNEITKKGVLAALDKPMDIDKKMVDAQQARRVLDRLVGYKISPLLWDKVRRGLSAGRVQSVALKLVCDREREIGAFVPEEYWNLTARLAGPVPPEFDAKLLKKGGANIKVGNEAESRTPCSPISKQARWVVDSVTTKERKKGAVPPFITSKLQQASRFPVKKTMMIAQQLYEGVELPGEGAVGLITYMRTDSTRVSEQAITDVREFIGDGIRRGLRAGEAERLQDEVGCAGRARSDPPDVDAVPPGSGPRAADAGSVLPLQVDLEPVRRLADAAGDVRRDDGGRRRRPTTSSASRARCRSSRAGWRSTTSAPCDPAEEAMAPGPDAKTAEDEEESSVLPPLAKGDALTLRELKPEQKFTQPPPRYTEATLVKALEENGIGRPSTYASIINVIQAREYVNKIEGKFKPTFLGSMLVEKLLSPAFDDILDVNYTRELEEDLDKIESGASDYVKHAQELLQEVPEGPEARREGHAQHERRV